MIDAGSLKLEIQGKWRKFDEIVIYTECKQ